MLRSYVDLDGAFGEVVYCTAQRFSGNLGGEGSSERSRRFLGRIVRMTLRKDIRKGINKDIQKDIKQDIKETLEDIRMRSSQILM